MKIDRIRASTVCIPSQTKANRNTSKSVQELSNPTTKADCATIYLPFPILAT